MNVLVLNSGSSSLRFQIIRIDPGGQEQRLAKGTVSRIGSHSVVTSEAPGQPRARLDADLPTHRDAIDWVLRWIVSPDSHIDAVKSLSDIDAVGHRVVHGGERFRDSAVITR
jgi:acetate kinase